MSTEVGRTATLRLEKREDGPVLKASVPAELSLEDFVRISERSYALISKLTGCNCLSGRISVIVEENWAEAIRVEL